MSIEFIFARLPRDCPLAGRDGRRLLLSVGRNEGGAVLFGGIVSGAEPLTGSLLGVLWLTRIGTEDE